MIHIEPSHREILLKLSNKYGVSFFAFGSRVKGTHRKFSDLDICIKTLISDAQLSHLEEDLEESDLPFKVDVVLWDRCSEDFKNNIANDLELIK